MGSYLSIDGSKTSRAGLEEKAYTCLSHFGWISATTLTNTPAVGFDFVFEAGCASFALTSDHEGAHFFFFLAMPAACRSFQARHLTHATAVTMPDP